MHAQMELLRRIAFGSDQESQAAAREAREAVWEAEPDAGEGDREVRRDCYHPDGVPLDQLVEVLTHALAGWVRLSDWSLRQQRAADRLIDRGALVRRIGRNGEMEVSMAIDTADAWDKRRQLCDPGWLLSLFLRDEVAAAKAASVVNESPEDFDAVERQLRAKEIEPLPLELLRFCWSRVSVSLSELAPAVWADPPTKDAVKKACGRANEKLAAISNRRSLSIAGDRLSWNR